MSLPSVDLLESRHEFPGPFTIKIIGTADENFIARVLAAVRSELDIQTDPPFKLRSTRKGRHVSITVHPEFETPQQVLAVYSRLSQLTGVVMIL